ncbi:hypothetical protein Fcan01_15437, partial [Folsomia candida]
FQVTNLLNMIYKLEKLDKPSSQKWSDLTIIRVMYMCQIASPIYSIATVLPVALDPCAAPWLGSLWLNFELDNTLSNICTWPKNSFYWDTIQLILWIFQSYFAVYIMCAWVTSGCLFLIVVLLSVTRLLQKLLENVEMEEGCSSYLIDRYRVLYVVEKCFNDSYQDGIIAFTIPGLVTCLIMVLCIVIRVSTLDGNVGLAVFPLIAVELVMLLGLFTRTGGNIYTTSGTILQNLRKRKHNKESFFKGRKSLEIKVLRSLPSLKVKFGQNFLEMATCINVLDFCVNRTVSLLLMN